MALVTVFCNVHLGKVHECQSAHLFDVVFMYVVKMRYKLRSQLCARLRACVRVCVRVHVSKLAELKMLGYYF